MATKMRIICKKNLVRSVMAKQIFLSKLAQHGLSDRCEIDTAGIQESSDESFLELEYYLNESLRLGGYSPVEKHRPKLVSSAWVGASDIAFTINSDIHDYLANHWNSRPAVKKKLEVLPWYGFSKFEKKSNDIFNPERHSISSQNSIAPFKYSPVKNIGIAVLKIAENESTRALVHKVTGYVPTTRDASYRTERLALYERTRRELEPCIDKAIAKMKVSGFF